MTFPVTKLKWVATTTAGGTPSVSEPKFWADEGDGLAWVSIGDMSGRASVAKTGRRVSEEGIAAARLPKGAPMTLLLSMYASLGHTAFLSTEASWNQAILGINVFPSHEVRFVKYVLDAIRPTLTEIARSNTQANLNAEQVGNLILPNPPLDEQRRIADFLDAETSRIDRLVDLRRLQLLSLEERVYAAVSETLVPGILESLQSPGPWPWMPAMAGDRPLVRLGYVCRLQNGLTIDSKRDLSGDVVTRPYLRVANVQAGHVDLESVVEITVPRDIANRTSLRPGDVLMTEGGDLDKLGRGTVWRAELPDCLHQNHVFALRPEPDRLDGDYLALMTRTLHGRCYFESTGSKTTNLASTNSSKIMSFPIPLPSVATQRALADEVRAVIDSSQAAKRLLERQLGLLAERRQALITAAVTGQFDVSTASGRNVTEGITA
ncbi:restriction endonuclease subunit S [Streptomyces sp. NPDC048577]|uniref:restriction endonuclease subunit S n=1 Tax=Streptomyces sp. NPDC048577 TaxID=3157209 RepID=UPI00341AFE33